MMQFEFKVSLYFLIRHYQVDKYKIKLRACIKVARHNMNLLENSESTICFLLFASTQAKRLAICSLHSDICTSKDTQHLEVSGTFINGGKFARIC